LFPSLVSLLDLGEISVVAHFNVKPSCWLHIHCAHQ